MEKVFVDYDGTITDEDTLDFLARRIAGEAIFREIDEQLDRGEIELRDALARELSLVRLSLDDADELIRTEVVFDPAFAAFVKRCRQRGVEVVILSSGLTELIERALQRNGIDDVPVIANRVEIRPDGWDVRFRDNVPNGTDKAAVVRAAKNDGYHTVFIGDGYSDHDAALVADTVFAKRGRSLEKFLDGKGVPYTPFSSFTEL